MLFGIVGQIAELTCGVTLKAVSIPETGTREGNRRGLGVLENTIDGFAESVLYSRDRVE